MNFYEVGATAALEKFAVVARGVKDFRRSLQLLHGGRSDRNKALPSDQLQDGYAFHGTTNLREILEQGKIVPGSRSLLSPEGVNEAYFGKSGPALPWASRSNKIIAVPTPDVLNTPQGDARVPPRVIPHATYLAGGHASPGEALDWVVTPHEVPLRPKHVVIGDLSAFAERSARAQHLRVIPPETFAAAIRKRYPKADW